ncbi:YihY/virulence factor BrkB family protein [Microbacterium sp. 1.5R]|uniref:YihY/virulence factor BrkB family protein n=1 Tax=Microbacterium sp. 1.5R TaxID=1916917 RepID=UPI001642CCB2|nr:YihY/virulence factor BrkB family protein [Microbacterium sp. 1.5R]
MTSSETPAPDDARPGFIQRVSAGAIRWALQRRAVRSFLLYSERRGPMLADSVTYRALFSVFAAVLLGFSIAALWLAGNPDAWRAIIDAVQSVVPGLIGEGGVINPDDLREPISLSVAGIVSAVALLGSALAAVGSLRTAIRVVAGTSHDDVLFIWVMLRNLLLAIGIGGLFVTAAGVTFVSRIGISWISGLLGIADDSAAATWIIGIASVLIVFALDTVLIAGVFRVLSGVKASAKSLWTGAIVGGAGLVVLQQLSSLFVGGATSNPLLASFASLLALLIWLNLSTQVILISSAFIVTSEEERHDRVRARFGATTFPQRRVQRAEVDVAIATAELRRAQEAEREAR